MKEEQKLHLFFSSYVTVIGYITVCYVELFLAWKKKEHAKTAASIPGKKDQNKQKIEKNVFNWTMQNSFEVS